MLFLSSNNKCIYADLRSNADEYINTNHLIELKCMVNAGAPHKYQTKIGRYSYGPICYNHPFIQSIGSFCSFAEGVSYVVNHEMRYITTHPMIYWGKNFNGFERNYEDLKEEKYYFPGVDPLAEKIKKQRRAVIGNDVWFGRNVIVVNSSNIGNGVIAGAGSIITKDVPDYAIVVGAPARIIKFRYSQDQIKALNKIAWWNWSDDEIRERFSDFYSPIDEFIKKYI